MYVDNHWMPVDSDDKAGFLEQINPVGGKYKVNPATTEVVYRTVPFYDQVVLVRVKDPSWTPRDLYIYYLTEQGNLYWLNGTSPPIHEINAKAPVRITDDNVLEYLKFFCFFVRGDEGPFLIAEGMDDAYMPQNIDDRTRSVIEGTIRPASYEGRNEAGNFVCDAVVFYSNALFTANFAVEPGGMIRMVEDNQIAGDLPIKISAPVA